MNSCFIFLGICVLSLVNAKYARGPCNFGCDEVKITDFDVKKISGIWYRYAMIDFPILAIATCTYDNFMPHSNLSATIQVNSLIYGEPTNHTLEVNYEPDGSHTDFVTAFNLPMKSRIIFLDNDVMAIVACQKRSVVSRKPQAFYVRIFTRLAFPACDSVEPALQALEKCQVKRESLKKEDRSKCSQCNRADESWYDERK